MKKCNKCGIEKQESEFNNFTKSKDGLYSICKKCRMIYAKENRDIINKYHSSWAKEKYKNDIEYRIKRSEDAKKYYKKHSARIIEYAKKYRIDHRESLLNNAKQYYYKKRFVILNKLKRYNQKDEIWAIKMERVKKYRENIINAAKIYFRERGINPKSVNKELIELNALNILLSRRIKKIKQGEKHG
jgi:hypothetical protein